MFHTFDACSQVVDVTLSSPLQCCYPFRNKAKKDSFGPTWKVRVGISLFFDWNAPISNNKLKLTVRSFFVVQDCRRVASTATCFVRVFGLIGFRPFLVANFMSPSDLRQNNPMFKQKQATSSRYSVHVIISLLDSTNQTYMHFWFSSTRRAGCKQPSRKVCGTARRRNASRPFSQIATR